ncbi:MAG: GTP 3',8-cyclase MoaA [Eubacteriales bacterium]|jgi:cyclic pyranopterin phosphate synthase
MRDGLGREIEYLRVSVTDRCNLRCRYCMPEQGVEPLQHAHILTYEELVQVCRCGVRLGLRRVKLTGGEPLVRRGVARLAGMLRQQAGVEEVTLTTNGVLLAEQAQPLYEAGVRRVNVSLDTLRPDRFAYITRREGLEQVLRGMETARQVGLEVKLNCVPQRGINEDEWVAFASLARREGWTVRFIELMPLGEGVTARGVPGEEVLHRLRQALPGLEPVDRQLGNGPATYWGWPDGTGYVGFISALHGPFCDRCNRVRLTADGQLRLCLASEEGVDVRALLRSGVGEDALCRAMEEAIGRKPAGHQLGSRPQRDRRMNQIGG